MSLLSDTFLSPEQLRFINICENTICQRSNYWRNKIDKETYCRECYNKEPLIQKSYCLLVTCHIIIIYTDLLIVRCSICSRNLSSTKRIVSCDSCWENFTKFWSQISETEKREIESFIEPTVICINIHTNSAN